MSTGFVKGDLVIVLKYDNNTYPAIVRTPIKGVVERLCAVIPLAAFVWGHRRPRFIPFRHLSHALWTFTGLVKKP